MFLSIDYGTRKSGLAYSVEGFAFSYGTVPTRELIPTVTRLIVEKGITTIVIGMPYNIDGTMSVHARRVEKFAKILHDELEKNHNNLKVRKSPHDKGGRGVSKMPNIVLHDERLTSSEARMSFDEDGATGDIDAEAARLILEGYMKR